MSEWRLILTDGEQTAWEGRPWTHAGNARRDLANLEAYLEVLFKTTPAEPGIPGWQEYRDALLASWEAR